MSERITWRRTAAIGTVLALGCGATAGCGGSSSTHDRLALPSVGHSDTQPKDLNTAGMAECYVDETGNPMKSAELFLPPGTPFGIGFGVPEAARKLNISPTDMPKDAVGNVNDCNRPIVEGDEVIVDGNVPCIVLHAGDSVGDTDKPSKYQGVAFCAASPSELFYDSPK